MFTDGRTSKLQASTASKYQYQISHLVILCLNDLKSSENGRVNLTQFLHPKGGAAIGFPSLQSRFDFCYFCIVPHATKFPPLRFSEPQKRCGGLTSPYWIPYQIRTQPMMLRSPSASQGLRPHTTSSLTSPVDLCLSRFQPNTKKSLRKFLRVSGVH